MTTHTPLLHWITPREDTVKKSLFRTPTIAGLDAALRTYRELHLWKLKDRGNA